MVGPRAYCTVHMMVCNREKAMLLFSRTLKQILGRPYTIIIDYPVQYQVVVEVSTLIFGVIAH